ncbi:hypothetical protein [Gracilibacillus salitolerans]|nr:hypothetical protein [Gracilibacillus salitolerans]
MEWYGISEMIDQLQYDDLPLEFDEEDIISKIENEAKFNLEANK